MAAVLRSTLTAGMALMSVGVLGTGGGQPVASPRLTSQAYRLAAESVTLEPSALLNVPINAVTMILSMPAWEFQAMDRFADAMIATGSWQVWSPTNVGGFDDQDPAKLAGLVDMLTPIQPFSSVFGRQLSWWAQANLPMNAGCAAVPGACPDLGAFMKGTMTVPLSTLTGGYQFPTSTNPFTLQPTTWSGQTVALRPGSAFTALWNYLSGPPAGIATEPIGQMVQTTGKLAKAISDAYYPYVQNSEWFNPRTTVFAPVHRALAPALCPTCDPAEPYNNPWLYENYPPHPAVVAQPAAAAPSESAPATATAPLTAPAAQPLDVTADSDDPVSPPAAPSTGESGGTDGPARSVAVQTGSRDTDFAGQSQHGGDPGATGRKPGAHRRH